MMSGSRRGNMKGLGKKKAKIEEVEDGSSSFRQNPPPWYLYNGMNGIPDGGIEDSDASAWKEKEELDPLAVFGAGIMMVILSKLDACSVALSRLVCRDWHSVASSDKIWLPKGFFPPTCHSCAKRLRSE